MSQHKPRMVLGQRRAAIYDFLTGKVYSINHSGRELLLSPRGRNNAQPTAEERAFLNQLEALGLSDWDLEGGRSGEDQSVTQLDHLDMEVTANCNLRCIHCYGFFGPRQDGHESLSLMRQMELLEEAQGLGCESVQFIGGEATTSDKLLPLVCHARVMGYDRLRVYTNGSLIDHLLAQTLAENEVSVRVSLYSHRSEVHDKITGQPGSFERTKRGILRLKSEGVKTEVAMIVLRDNRDDVDGLRLLVEGLGVGWAGCDVVRPIGRGRNTPLSPTDPMLSDARVMSEPDFRTSWATYERCRTGNSCWLGQATITNTGDILPCVFSRELVAGNAKTKSLHQVITEGLSTYWRVSRDCVEVCSECEYRYCCFDCRPLAMSAGTGLHGRGRYCTYSPAQGLWSHTD